MKYKLNGRSNMSFKKTVCGLLAAVFCITAMTVTAFAQELSSTVVSTNDTIASDVFDIQEARASYAII